VGGELRFLRFDSFKKYIAFCMSDRHVADIPELSQVCGMMILPRWMMVEEKEPSR